MVGKAKVGKGCFDVINGCTLMELAYHQFESALGFQLIGVKGDVGFSKFSYQGEIVGFRKNVDFYNVVGQDCNVEAVIIDDFTDFFMHLSEAYYSLQENRRRLGLPSCDVGGSLLTSSTEIGEWGRGGVICTKNLKAIFGTYSSFFYVHGFFTKCIRRSDG